MPSLGELFVDLGFNVDNQTLKDFNSEIKDTMASVLKLGGVTASAAGFVHLLNGAADTATELQNLTVQFGLNQRAIQEYAAAAHTANPLMSVEQGLQSAKHVAEYIRDMQLGKGGNELGQFGGGPEDNTFEKVIARVRNNFARVVSERGIAQATQWAAAITGSAESVNVLKMSLSDYHAAGAKGIVDQKELDDLAKYNVAISDLSNTFEKLKISFVSLAATGFNDVAGNMKKQGFLAGLGQSLDDLGAYNPFGLGRKQGLFNSDKIYGNDGGAAAGASDAQSKALSYFQAQGWSAEQAQGIVAELKIESSTFDPQAYNPKGGGNGAVGIAQWRGSRQADLEKFLGHSWKTATQDEELAFVNFELTRGNYKAAGDKIRTSSSRDDTLNTMESQYEINGKGAVTVHMTNNFTGGNPQENAQAISDQIYATRNQQSLGPVR